MFLKPELASFVLLFLQYKLHEIVQGMINMQVPTFLELCPKTSKIKIRLAFSRIEKRDRVLNTLE